jgi:CheY-like chemotaxis protein
MATTLRDPQRQAELEALAARVAGELGNLLAPLLGNATLLEEELPEGHALRRRAKTIQDAAVAARVFAQRVLTLEPKRAIALHEQPVAELLESCLPALRAQLGPGLDLASGSTSGDPVRIDRKQIELALVELVRNAQEAMGGGRIEIASAAVEGGRDGMPEGRWVRLRVDDRGPGPDPFVGARAFEPGVTTKVPRGGAGLGLAIVAAVARRHGGFAELATRDGGGATASLFLPRSQGPVPIRPAYPARPTVVSQEGQGRVVLLVEDNPMVRRSIEATLRVAGYQVISVGGGEPCLELLGRRDTTLDLLITDVVMPVMSGEVLIERVRALRPELPVLFISGYDRSTLAHKHPGRLDHFLQKPFDSQDLFAAVRAALAEPPAGKP